MEPQIFKKIESLPFLMQKEVNDFVDFLISKTKKEAKKRSQNLEAQKD